MATELGKAYVQIIPSAKGISGAIQNQLGPEADAAGSSAGNSAGSKLVSVLKGVIATAAIGKAIGASLMEGANLEQSLGGIETLFKGSADKVKKYADEAYKTAGLSANDYMENVTSFSASLLQSMGGDTEKAADKANMAMIDMSDNANKMGTNMEDIQNAYQGFAKQNYTMLDNLKLGYGGTKEEMQRLLSDAQKLTGVKYDINNLSDVYSAIHAVQEELDITGTTAKEAAETFSGSLSAMKSAFSNVLGNLSLGRDIGPSLKALAETTSTFLIGNLLPMIVNILKTLPGAIVTFFKAAVPLFFNAGKEFISSLTNGMSGGGNGIFYWLQNSIKWISLDMQNLALQMKDRVGAIKDVFQKLSDGVQPTLTKLSAIFSGWAIAISGVLSYAIPLAVDVLIAVFDGFQSFILPIIDNVLSKVWEFSSIITEAILNYVVPALQGMIDWISSNKSIMEGLGIALGIVVAGFLAFKTITSVISVFNTVKTAIMGVATAFKGLTLAMTINPFGLIIAAIAALVAGFIYLWNTNEAFKNAVIGIWTSISEFLSPIISGIVEFITMTWGLLVEWWNANNQSFLSTITMVWESIKGVFDVVLEAIALVVTTILTNIKTFWDTWGQAITAGIQVMWAFISSVFGNTLNNILAGVTFAFNQIGATITFIMDIVKNVIKIALSLIKGDWSGVLDGIKGIVSAFGDFIGSTFNNFMTLGKDIIKNGVNSIKGFFDKLGDIDLLEAGKAIINGFVDGLKAAWDKGMEFIGGIGDWIKEHKGPISYDRKLLIPAGKAIMNGLDAGLRNQFKEVQSNVLSMADVINDSMALDGWQLAGASLSAAIVQQSDAKRYTPQEYDDQSSSSGNNNQVIEVHVHANIGKKELIQEIAEPLRVVINKTEQRNARKGGQKI